MDAPGVFGRDLWRQEDTTTTAPGCTPVSIPSGTVIVNATYTVVLNGSSQAMFTPMCNYGSLPVTIGLGETMLAYFFESASNFTQEYSFSQMSGSPFYKSTPPIVIVLSTVTFGIWALALSVWPSVFGHTRDYKFRLATSIVAPICITLITMRCFYFIKYQHDRGYTDGLQLAYFISASNLIAICMMISNLVALFTQVRTTISLFSRKKEQMLILWAGSVLVITCQTLWAFNIFEPPEPDQRTDSTDALVVFSYLFIVATSILFVCCVAFYSALKWRVAYRPAYLPLAFLSLISACLPVILFFLDVCNRYVSGWDSLCRVWSLMAAGIIVAKWADQIEEYESLMENNSVLGRKTYTEDEAELPPGATRPSSTDLEEDSDKRIRDVEMGHWSESHSMKSTDEEDPKLDDQDVYYPSSDDRWYSHLKVIPALVKQLLTKRPGTSASYTTTYVVKNNFMGSDNISSSVPIPGPPSRPVSIASSDEVPQQDQPIVHIHPFRKQTRKPTFNDDNDRNDDSNE